MLDNQKNEIEKYAECKGIRIDRFVTEVVSGKTRGRDRKLGLLIKQLRRGDTLIVTEVSRLSRTMMDIMSIVGELLNKGVHLYSTKEGFAFDDTINSKVLIFAFGLVAEIERNLISLRTREALELRRQQGIQLGRREGSWSKLNVIIDNEGQVETAIRQGATVMQVCKQYQISKSTYYRYRKIVNFQ